MYAHIYELFKVNRAQSLMYKYKYYNPNISHLLQVVGSLNLNPVESVEHARQLARKVIRLWRIHWKFEKEKEKNWKFKKRDLCVKNLKKGRNTLEIWKREIHVVLVGLGTHCTYLNPYLYLYLICICMTKITWCLFVLASWLAYCIFCSSEDLCRESAAIRSFPISFLNKKAWNQCFKEKCHQNQGKGEGSLLRRVSSHL